MTLSSSATPLSQTQAAFRRRGVMLVLASPPGGGKTTITRELMRSDAQTVVSVSATTRAKRPGEVEGTHYYFVSPEKFKAMDAAGEMLETALVYNKNYYGTPKAPVEEALSEGKDVLFDIDWQGNRSLRAAAPADVVSVYILPPSWEALASRLHTRAQDSEEEITRRLGMAQEEIAHYREFQYVIVNNDLGESVQLVHNILRAERARRERLLDLDDFVKTLKP
ncbi:MAG: guanylate kinase [Alphaproteobacteria bacterium]|nr:guanylate kinase [Alphaproteobacteria bacterium]MDE2336035.1 guanylate kinase [Alphaproteobacteria bacterium]